MQYEELVTKLKNLKNNNSKYSYICKIIVENLNRIEKIDISKLSELSFASKATVTRACQYIGLSGYKELTSILVNYNSDELFKFNPVSSKLMNEVANNILETNLLKNDEAIKEICEILKNSKKIVLIGFGESLTLLRSFQSRLFRIGIYPLLLTEFENQQVYSSMIDETTNVIALSLSGSTKSVFDQAQIAKLRGANLISITKYSKNPIKSLSDIHISISHNPEENFLITRVARYSIIFIFDLIFEIIIASDPKKYTEILKKTAITATK